MTIELGLNLNSGDETFQLYYITLSHKILSVLPLSKSLNMSNSYQSNSPSSISTLVSVLFIELNTMFPSDHCHWPAVILKAPPTLNLLLSKKPFESSVGEIVMNTFKQFKKKILSAFQRTTLV